MLLLSRTSQPTYLTHLVVELNERVHGLNSQETIVHSGILRIRKQDIRRDNGCKIVRVHLASRLLIDLMERGSPIEERAENLQAVSVGLRK